MEQSSKPLLIYVYDPLCGWCYGFSPVVQDLFTEYSDRIDFQVISGGMITDTRVHPLSERASYIQTAYKEVEKLSGVKFGEKYLKVLFGDGVRLMDSEPPSRVHTLLCARFPDKHVQIAGDIQKAIFEEGLDAGSKEFIDYMAGLYSISEKALAEELQVPEWQERTRDEFRLAGQMGITAYPALLIYTDQWYLIARGYTGLAQIKNTIDKLTG